MSDLSLIDTPRNDADADEPEGRRDRLPLAVVVEDDSLVRSAVSAYLEVLGCEVAAAASAEDASALLETLARRPRFMICDYGLPDGRNGLQVIAQARGRLGEGFPAFLLTGTVSRDVSRHCHERGVDVIFKPVSPGILASIVRRVCA